MSEFLCVVVMMLLVRFFAASALHALESCHPAIPSHGVQVNCSTTHLDAHHLITVLPHPNLVSPIHDANLAATLRRFHLD
jgi:hypothetical protein